MAGVQTSKILLHAQAVDGKAVHRWIVAAFANKSAAGTYAGMIKAAHAAGDWARVLTLDPSHAKSADGTLLTPVKLSAATVAYNPHNSVGNGLDED